MTQTSELPDESLATAPTADDQQDAMPDASAAEAREVETPSTLAASLRLHWVFLCLSVLVLFLSFVMKTPDEELVFIPFTEVPMPGLCAMRETTGVNCPGCGLTRCFISLADGQFERAWDFNPAGYLVFVFVVAQIPYRSMQIRRIRRGRAEWSSPLIVRCLLVVIGALILQWVVRGLIVIFS